MSVVTPVIHVANLGDKLFIPRVAAAFAALSAALPEAEFHLTVSGQSFSELLGPKNAPTVVAAPPVTTSAPTVTAPVQQTAPVTASAETTATAGKVRRTKEESEAGLDIDQAKAFRAQTVYKTAAEFAQSLVGAAEDAVDATLAADAPTPAPEPEPTPTATETAPVVITEADVRAAAVAGVKGGSKDKVIAIAKEYGVSDWKNLDASKYKEVFDKLTAVLVVK